ncbi:MAG: ABC transporter ATP-binding protein [Myxococcota bacterium]
MIALELSGVTKRYGARTALDGVDLAIPRGSSLGLLGPNGAGKTTALKLLLGFVRPTAGEVRVGGLDPSEPASREGLGYLPERLSLPGRMTVGGFLRLHAKLARLTGSEREREVGAVLELTGIADRERDRLAGLSKGLRQRVGFAQALLGPPETLLLDEPTSGLDPIGVRDARDWIRGARERGCTVLVSSHILSEVEKTCDRVAILHEGRVVASGALHDVVAPGESLEDAFVRLVRR